jgi:protein gp37
VNRTKIEWTDATWNPIRGCTRVSEGCRNCYAEAVAARFSGPGLPYEGLARPTPAGPRWTGEVRLIEKHLGDPLRWAKPRRIFVNSMSDLFHERLEDDTIDRIFAVMAECPQHTFQVLTKRPQRMLDYLGNGGGAHLRIWCRAGEPATMPWPLPNVWLGVSAEHQSAADERIPRLLATVAAVRFVSAEPLLGHINLYPFMRLGRGLDWVIVGGESGPNARPMHPDWARSIRDQCLARSVAFFFKQWGEYEPAGPVYGDPEADLDGRGEVQALDTHGYVWMDDKQPPLGSWYVERVGKRRAGRALDGRTHDHFPVIAGPSQPGDAGDGDAEAPLVTGPQKWLTGSRHPAGLPKEE